MENPISLNRPMLSNLFFVDYIVLFAEASINQAPVMHECLRKLCLASGQKISLPNSRVYFSTNIPLSQQYEITQALQIEATSDLGTYLGMPIFTEVTRVTFSHLCEKIDRMLVGWKTKYLSLAGCITLTKSTLWLIIKCTLQRFQG